MVGELTHMRSMCVGVAETGVEHRSPAKKHKETFLLSYFSVTKRRVQGGEATSERRRRDGVSGKSHLRGFSILLKITFRVHELVAGSSAWQVRAAKDRAKIGSFALPATSYYHACEHSARKSRADSCTHCLHARYKCKAGVNLICALTE